MKIPTICDQPMVIARCIDSFEARRNKRKDRSIRRFRPQSAPLRLLLPVAAVLSFIGLIRVGMIVYLALR